MSGLKFGKLPARPNAIKLKFSDVFKAEKLPTPPAVFGHETLMSSGEWFMLGNDSTGDCVFAGACHEHMLWTMEGGFPRATFTAKDALSDYSAVTGYNPADPSTDQGTDMQQAASYRRTTGILDATGVRHKVGAYVAIKAGDLSEIALAAYLFGAVGIGFRCPSSMEDQFDQGKPWQVVPGDIIVGGHYVPCVGRNSSGDFLFITWGKLHAATPEWVSTYMDEGVAYLSPEIINQSKLTSPEGFDEAALNGFLNSLPT